MLGMRSGMKWTRRASLRRGGARGGVIRAPAASLGSRQAAAGAGKGQNIPRADAFRDTAKLRFHSFTDVKCTCSPRPVSTAVSQRFLLLDGTCLLVFFYYFNYSVWQLDPLCHWSVSEQISIHFQLCDWVVYPAHYSNKNIFKNLWNKLK